VSKRRIKQISAAGFGEDGQFVIVLADDGTLWEYLWANGTGWEIYSDFPPLPDTAPEGTET
jgi:hypothetical protein